MSRTAHGHQFLAVFVRYEILKSLLQYVFCKLGYTRELKYVEGEITMDEYNSLFRNLCPEYEKRWV